MHFRSQPSHGSKQYTSFNLAQNAGGGRHGKAATLPPNMKPPK